MSRKKSSTKKKTAAKKTSKKARSTETLRQEAIGSIDEPIARVDGEALAEGARGHRRKAKKAAAAVKGESKPKAAGKAKGKAGADTGEGRQRRAKRERKPSGLDLAAKALAEAKEPLNAKAIAERAIAAGWKTNGATSHATLYSAMIREIATKGKDARFKKTDRELFTASK